MDKGLDSMASHRDSLSSRFEHIISAEEFEEIRDQIVDDVRIKPTKMVFKDAYDGKVFSQHFTITNCGKNTAFIRILTASSKAFKLKSVPKGHRLPAGMSITRNISYTHTSAMALPQACIPIYINEKRVMYHIEVHLISPHVTLTPKIIEFGEIDVRTASQQKVLELCNDGHKVTQFSIDLGRTDLELIVQPMKGIIQPYEVIKITVEVLGSKLGYFEKEFWIRTEPPQRVKFCGIFILPKLMIEHPLSNFRLVLIDFPKTYFGAEIIKTLVIRNYSSSAAMFCVVAESEGGFEYLTTARKANDELKSFYIQPKEGRLQSQQKYIVKFKFCPKKTKHFTHDFSMVFLNLMKLHYRDGIVVEKDVEVKTFPPPTDIEQFSVTSLEDHIPNFFSDDCSGNDFIRICLYGEMEEAAVELTPSTFSMTYLKQHETYGYAINIKNMSQYLPIMFRYTKVACIEIEPKQALLGPSSSIEVAMYVKPSRIGQVDVNVMFDLIYKGENDSDNVGTACLPVQYIATMDCPVKQPKFNMGITPKITNEVGVLVDDVRFNSAINKPIQAIVDQNYKSFNANNNDLIAFPNDRPKSLRPWKSQVPCRTIFMNLPRLVTEQDGYTLNPAEWDVKKFTTQFYTNYIRASAHERHRNRLIPDTLPDYSVNDSNLNLMKQERFGDCRPIHKPTPRATVLDSIALTPEQLVGIKITPKYVDLGQIAPYTVSTDSFYIENNNDFFIIVSIKALSNSVVIKGKQRMVIGPKTTRNISFKCWTHGIGKYYVPVFIIINDTHIFDATVFAKVVPTTVICPTDEIFINPKDNRSFFEIFNPVNCDISFSWEVQDNNFEVYPPSGKVPARKSLYCRVMFFPEIFSVYKTEIYLRSQSGAKQIISVIYDNVKAPVGFHTNVVTFTDIPLNMPTIKELVLRNYSETEIGYFILNPNPLAEITVAPVSGKIMPKSDVFFEITAHFKAIVKFNCLIEFILQNEYSYIVNVEGNVEYPELHLEPEFIQIHKIVSGAYIRRVFRVRNTSQAESTVTFHMDDFPEFFVTDTQKNAITEPISLQPHESKDLFLEFRPIEPVAYSIFLPYMINGIVGPPALNDPCSLDPSTYFKHADDKFKTAIPLPEALSVVRVRCAAGAPWIKFSSLTLHFSCRRKKHFIVTNISSVEHMVTIPLIDPQHPYSLEVEEGNEYRMRSKYYEACMKPGEEVIFAIEFNPTEFGTHDTELPIFLDKSVEKCPFNYLKLCGSYTMPDIVCNRNILYYQVIRVQEKVNEKITLDMIAHKEDCVLDATVSNEMLTVKLSPKTSETHHKSELSAIVTFYPLEECFVESEIIFSCSCGTSYNLPVRACADNSLCASYESFIRMRAVKFSEKFQSTFPYFPRPSDDSSYASKLRVMRQNLEHGLYAQKFFMKNFYRIPDGVCRQPLYIQQKQVMTSVQKPPVPVLPLVEMLIQLINQSVVKCFDDRSLAPASEGVEGAVYMYTIYRNIYNFLKSYKVYVPQLEPEYLLPYKLYIIFKEHICDDINDENNSAKESILSQQDFYYFSAQCWVDLLLRIYKVFVLERIMGSKSSKIKPKHYTKYDIYHKDFMRYYAEHKKELEDQNESEGKLLLWLEFHFERHKSILWDLEVHQQLQKSRKIRSFDLDLWDGLVFATIFVSYCPYLEENFKGFYPSFGDSEQIFHNSCVIFEAMRKINLTLRITPPNLIRPSTTEMIMFTCYLYDVLPGFYPKETISFEAPLGETATNEIVLKNDDAFTIAYTVIFFSNDTNDFEVDAENAVISPKKDKTLKITYTAKSVEKKSAVLLLSGETYGFKHAKSVAFNLLGIPNTFNFTAEYNLKVDVFACVPKNIDVFSPFEKPYTAKLYLYLTDDLEVRDHVADFVAVSSLAERHIPREVNMDSSCVFDNEGYTALALNLCYVSCGEFSYFIYFLNREEGDFCIKVNITSHMNKKNFVTLEVPLPVYFSTTIECQCNKTDANVCRCTALNFACTKLIVVDIPIRNSQLIDALRLMLKNCSEESEYEFWDSLLDYPKGFTVFRNYLKQSFEDALLPFKNVLSPAVTYNVEFSKKKVNYPKLVTFDNVMIEGVFRCPFHWNRPEEPREEVLTLYADHDQEIRQYRLIFIPPNIPGSSLIQ